MSEQRQRSERHVHISPYYRQAAWEPFNDWPTSRLFDQDFGMPANDLNFELQRQRLFRDPWANRQPSTTMTNVPPPMLTRQLSGGLSQVSNDKDKFTISLDVKHFSPEEISVKTIGGFVEVRGKHEAKEDDHGVVSRDFTRKYTIPSNVDPLTVTSSLSQDGFLTIEAPFKKDAITGPKLLPVQHVTEDASSSESKSTTSPTK